MPPLLGAQIPDLLRDAPAPWGDAVTISVESSTPPGVAGDRPIVDFVVRLTWNGTSRAFAAESKTRSTPQALELAVAHAHRRSAQTGLLPMVVLPYLPERHVATLIDRGVSGLDLSGNGVVIVPGELLMCRSGRPNRFPESQPVRFGYRGSTSLVPRAFLLQSAFASVQQIGQFIQQRGVRIAPSTVSKALQRLEEDVMIARDPRRIALLQPDRLLDRLSNEYRPSRSQRVFELRTGLSVEEVFRRLPEDLNATLSGAASAVAYTSGARGDAPIIYCEQAAALKAALGAAWRETDRFADLHVIESHAKEIYFDLRRGPDGVRYASEIQSYIELSRGDKRDRQMADQIRERLLRTLRGAREDREWTQ